MRGFVLSKEGVAKDRVPAIRVLVARRYSYDQSVSKLRRRPDRLAVCASDIH